MRRPVSLACTLALLVSVLVGCTTVHNTQSFNGVKVDGGREPVATVEIENSGWYFLTCLPVASGDYTKANRAGCTWFKDTVRLENNLKVLGEEMKKAKVTEVANLTSHRTDEKYLVFILSRRAYHTSAVLLKPETKE